MKYKVRILGVSIQAPTFMYEDNQSVIISASTPKSTLKKHDTLAYCRTKEVTGKVDFRFIKSKENWAKLLTKALPPR